MTSKVVPGSTTHEPDSMNYMAITIMFLHPRSIALIHLFVVYERRETRLYPPLGEVKNEKREKRQGKGCRKEKGETVFRASIEAYPLSAFTVGTEFLLQRSSRQRVGERSRHSCSRGRVSRARRLRGR